MKKPNPTIKPTMLHGFPEELKPILRTLTRQELGKVSEHMQGDERELVSITVYANGDLWFAYRPTRSTSGFIIKSDGTINTGPVRS